MKRENLAWETSEQRKARQLRALEFREMREHGLNPNELTKMPKPFRLKKTLRLHRNVVRLVRKMNSDKVTKIRFKKGKLPKVIPKHLALFIHLSSTNKDNLLGFLKEIEFLAQQKQVNALVIAKNPIDKNLSVKFRLKVMVTNPTDTFIEALNNKKIPAKVRGYITIQKV